MDVKTINRHLSVGAIDESGLFPHLEDLENKRYIFEMDFGLEALPDEPGLIVVRGPRQYGKSTWLEQQLRATVTDHGPGTAYYLNGDEITTADALMASHAAG